MPLDTDATDDGRQFPIRGSDAAIVRSLRRLLVEPCPGDREILARHSVAYVRAYILTRLRRKRFGFDDGFADVATWVADTQIAELLVERSSGGSVELPKLRAAVARSARGAVETGAPVATLREHDPESVTNGDLLQQWRAVLRAAAEQGIIRAWKESHPDRARELRRLKRHLAQQGEIRIVRGLWGQILVSPESDLRLPGMDQDVLAARVRVRSSGAKGLLLDLRDLLRPESGHGGHCHLMDLLHVWDSAMREQLRHALASDGCASTMPLVEGFPAAPVLDGFRRRIAAAARDLLRQDRAKGRFEGDPDLPGCPLTRAYVGIATEMLLRRHGLDTVPASPAERSSQRTMIAAAIPEAADGPGARRHRLHIDYLIRRLASAVPLR